MFCVMKMKGFSMSNFTECFSDDTAFNDAVVHDISRAYIINNQ